MCERLGYMVAVWNQASGQPEDTTTTDIHRDIADAEAERDWWQSEYAKTGRRERFEVCEIVPISADS